MEIDGRAVSPELARMYALTSYGHFTAMQVRGGRVRGLALHLERLSRATAEMFGVELDRESVRARIRHALGGGQGGGGRNGPEISDASVRVLVFQPQEGEPATLVVFVREPYVESGAPQSLMSVPYQRPLAHLKQVGGGFGQAYHGRAAERAGFDDALLTAVDGTVSEGAIANIAFVADGGLVWPDAPALAGITMQLLHARLSGSGGSADGGAGRSGVGSRIAPVRLADLGSYDAALLTNSRGVAPVSRIDDHWFAGDPKVLKAVRDEYESVPWDVI